VKNVLGIFMGKMERPPCPWIGRINIIKITILLKSNLSTQCNPLPS
jgi:hypothetical protein